LPNLLWFLTDGVQCSDGSLTILLAVTSLTLVAFIF